MKKEFLEAIKSCEGRVTAGDIVSKLAISRAEAEDKLQSIAKDFQCFIEVTEEGELIYNFGKSFTPIFPFKERFFFALKRFFFLLRDTTIFLFKIWIMVMLILYFIIYLLIFLILIAGRGRVRIDLRPVVEIVKTLIKKIPKKRKEKKIEEYVELKDKSLWEIDIDFGEEEKLPLYERIFKFVFGNPSKLLGQKEKDLIVINYILTHKGVIVPVEIAGLFGLSLSQAKKEIARVFAKYEGEVEVSENGVIIYSFPTIMKRVAKEKKIKKEELLCNFQKEEINFLKQTKKELWIPIINGFNMGFAIFMHFYLLENSELAGKILYFFLVSFPLIFSILFFAFPFLRLFYRSITKKERMKKFIFSAFQKFLFKVQKSIKKDEFFTKLQEVSLLPISEKVFNAYEDELVLSHNGEIKVTEKGKIIYEFPEVFLELKTIKEKRKKITDEAYSLGKIEYSTK